MLTGTARSAILIEVRPACPSTMCGKGPDAVPEQAAASATFYNQTSSPPYEPSGGHSPCRRVPAFLHWCPVNTAALTAESTVTLPRWAWTAVGSFIVFVMGLWSTTYFGNASRLRDAENRLNTLQATVVSEQRVREIVAADAPYLRDREWLTSQHAELKSVVVANTSAINGLRVLMAESLAVRPAEVLEEVKRLRQQVQALEGSQ